MQQYLPLAVLKPDDLGDDAPDDGDVATVLTACGIETYYITLARTSMQCHVATVLTACGIETKQNSLVLTATMHWSCNSTYRLRY